MLSLAARLRTVSSRVHPARPPSSPADDAAAAHAAAAALCARLGLAAGAAERGAADVQLDMGSSDDEVARPHKADPPPLMSHKAYPPHAPSTQLPEYVPYAHAMSRGSGEDGGGERGEAREQR
jgi:hypothetical protein